MRSPSFSFPLSLSTGSLHLEQEKTKCLRISLIWILCSSTTVMTNGFVSVVCVVFTLGLFFSQSLDNLYSLSALHRLLRSDPSHYICSLDFHCLNLRRRSTINSKVVRATVGLQRPFSCVSSFFPPCSYTIHRWSVRIGVSHTYKRMNACLWQSC